MTLRFLLPLANASFTLIAFILMLLGRAAIRRREVEKHKWYMFAAFVFSCFFMITFISRIALFGLSNLEGQGAMKVIYIILMAIHDAPAVVTVPLVITSMGFGFARNYKMHKELVSLAYPFWVYSSITGLLLYALLFKHRGDWPF